MNAGDRDWARSPHSLTSAPLLPHGPPFAGAQDSHLPGSVTCVADMMRLSQPEPESPFRLELRDGLLHGPGALGHRHPSWTQKLESHPCPSWVPALLPAQKEGGSHSRIQSYTATLPNGAELHAGFVQKTSRWSQAVRAGVKALVLHTANLAQPQHRRQPLSSTRSEP